MSTTTRKPLEQEIAELRKLYGTTEEQLTAAQERDELLGEELDANAERETAVALGECTAEEVASERQKLLVEKRQAEEDVRRLTAASAGMAPRMDELKNRLELRVRNHAEDDYLTVLAAHDKLCESVVSVFANGVSATRSVIASRILVDQARGRFEAAGGEPETVDEVDFRPDSVEQLIAFLLEGPRAPAFTAQRARRNAEEERQRTDRDKIRWAAGFIADATVDDALEYTLAQIGEEYRERVLEEVREIRRQRLLEWDRINSSMRESARADASPTALEAIAAAEDEDAAELTRRLADLGVPTGEPAETNGAGEPDLVAEVAGANARLLP